MGTLPVPYSPPRVVPPSTFTRKRLFPLHLAAITESGTWAPAEVAAPARSVAATRRGVLRNLLIVVSGGCGRGVRRAPRPSGGSGCLVRRKRCLTAEKLARRPAISPGPAMGGN